MCNSKNFKQWSITERMALVCLKSEEKLNCSYDFTKSIRIFREQLMHYEQLIQLCSALRMQRRATSVWRRGMQVRQ
jgi:hypothetical protein